jgi:hypothetical protein
MALRISNWLAMDNAAKRMPATAAARGVFKLLSIKANSCFTFSLLNSTPTRARILTRVSQAREATMVYQTMLRETREHDYW